MTRGLVTLLLWCVLSAARADCFDRAAARFRLNANLLRAIAEQETRNRTDALGPLLADGNRGLGEMQVNSIHLPELARYNVTRQDLMTPCGSVFVGAWILAGYARAVGNTWAAVGVYNTGPASKDQAAQARYIAGVRRRFERIERESSAAPSSHPATNGAMAVWRSE